MMQMTLIIFLVGVSYSPSTSDQPDTTSPPIKPTASPAQQRVHAGRQLKMQIEQWRTQASQVKTQEIAQVLKKTPDVAELELIVGTNWDQVTKLLINEMRNRQANRWEKVYVGRHLLTLLNRAPRDDLARQARLLVQAFQSAPDPIRTLPEQSVKSLAPQQTPATKSEPEQAKEEARSRDAQYEQIMLINQSVDVLRQNFTALMLENSDRHTYTAIIKTLHQQLMDTDASFVGTVEALEAAQLDKLDIPRAKTTLRRLKLLAKAFAGPRQYTVYTEVKKHQDKRSDFGLIELDFYKTIENTLSRLTERIETGRLRESSEPMRTVPELLERTPGPSDTDGY